MEWDSQNNKCQTEETNYVTSLQYNNTAVTDSKLIANLFYYHFSPITKNIEQTRIALISKCFDYLKNPCQETFLTPTNEQEVLKSIKLLKRNKSSKRTKQTYVFDYKLFLFNMNFSNYTKNGKSNSLLLKRRSFSLYQLLNNLFPIKPQQIIETLVYEHFSDFLTEQNVLYEKQFAFRNNCSTMHALTEVT